MTAREIMTENSEAKALYRAFLVCLIVVSLPIKNAAYVAPALYLAVLWLHGEYQVLRRVFIICTAVLLISSFAVLWDHLAGRTVNFPGLLLGLMTYAAMFVVLCETFGRTIDEAEYGKYAKICVWFILVQSAIGLFQYAATRNSDAVCGTFGLLDGFKPSVTIAQVYFTFTILGMILFIVPVANNWPARLAIVAGALTCVVAQSGHQLIFFVIALVVCGLARLSHFGTVLRSVAAAALLSWLILELAPDTLTLARDWYTKVTDSDDSPKRLVYEGALSILQDPKNLLIGTGLGQYCSRAALIASDEYLYVKLPGFLTGKSDYFDAYVDPGVVLFFQIGEGSAISKPYMSLLSVPVEFGLLLTVGLLAVICRCVIWCARVMSGHGDEVRWIGFSMMVGILFFVLCCFIENYAEFSQAIFLPFILYVVAGSRVRTVLRAAQATSRAPKPRTSYAMAARPLPR